MRIFSAAPIFAQIRFWPFSDFGKYIFRIFRQGRLGTTKKRFGRTLGSHPTPATIRGPKRRDRPETALCTWGGFSSPHIRMACMFMFFYVLRLFSLFCFLLFLCFAIFMFLRCFCFLRFSCFLMFLCLCFFVFLYFFKFGDYPICF